MPDVGVYRLLSGPLDNLFSSRAVHVAEELDSEDVESGGLGRCVIP